MADHESFAVISPSSEEAVIRQYFVDGYKYNDIRKFLQFRHGISLTSDQLRRRLKIMGLKRRGVELQSSLEDVQEAIAVSQCLNAVHIFHIKLLEESFVLINHIHEHEIWHGVS